MNKKIKNIIKYTAQLLLTWGMVWFVSYVSYSLMMKQVIQLYNESGWEAALFGVALLTGIYTAILFIIAGIVKLFEWAFIK